MRRLVVRLEAEADMREAAGWYDQQAPGLGADLLQAVWRTFDSIIESPLRYPIVADSVRRAMTARFPFLAYYTVDADEVCVLAVLHGRRDPAEWRRRAGPSPPNG